MTGRDGGHRLRSVTPVLAGIHPAAGPQPPGGCRKKSGMTGGMCSFPSSFPRRRESIFPEPSGSCPTRTGLWIPACAGMTGWG